MRADDNTVQRAVIVGIAVVDALADIAPDAVIYIPVFGHYQETSLKTSAFKAVFLF